MQVIEYHNCDRQEHWLEQIKKSDWSAGQFLYELLKESKFFEMVGEKSRVMLLVDGDDLISFCTYAEKDDIQPTELTPWIGFVYTFPQYRGQTHESWQLQNHRITEGKLERGNDTACDQKRQLL